MALNRVWGIACNRSFLRNQLVSFGLIFACGGLAFLSMMLGVRRSGVTIAAGALQKQGLIRYVRGSVTVLSRLSLEAASCECYAGSRDTYSKVLSPRSSRE